jgi:enoyl-CoA hydratase
MSRAQAPDRRHTERLPNRPERLNAVSETQYGRLNNAVNTAEPEPEPEVRSVNRGGAGRAFCFYAGLKAHGRRRPDEGPAATGGGRRERIRCGGGSELAVTAAFLGLSAKTQLRFPAASIVTFVGGVSHRLRRLVGLRRAARLLVLVPGSAAGTHLYGTPERSGMRCWREQAQRYE